jgi:hypothetical protein
MEGPCQESGLVIENHGRRYARATLKKKLADAAIAKLK